MGASFRVRRPAAKDYLRKLARDTEAEKLEKWYNRHAAALYAELNTYDEEGIFLADGSYLFVPDSLSTTRTRCGCCSTSTTIR